MSTTAEKINIELKEHQMHAGNWGNKCLAESLHIWAERLMVEFKLKCTVPALRVDGLRSNCYGHFRIGRNGFGVLNEIAINDKHVNGTTVDFEVCGSLLHELLHSEQQALGTEGKTDKHRNYHNTALIERARSLGLIIDHWGHQKYSSPPTPFSELLAKYGIEVPPMSDEGILEAKPKAIVAGTSKLKLWVCSCKPKPVHVRVAIADFRARCLNCNELFVRKG